MPDLAQSLAGQDLGHLRILADAWGLELLAPDARKGLLLLTRQILVPELVSEVVEALPLPARQALQSLLAADGRLTWTGFVRRHGEVREMGPGRRDRERPDRDPISVAETLWYRGLIGRAFFETASGLQEFAYIPDDLLPLIPALSDRPSPDTRDSKHPVWGRAATPAERAFPILANDRILDHLCTALAAKRVGISPLPIPDDLQTFVQALLVTSELIDEEGQPLTDALRGHLEADRGQALVDLVQIWLNSQTHNDLHHVPDLQPEGEWRNDPHQARHFLVNLLLPLPEDHWWSLSALIADIHQRVPDFQRPAGDYDSWFIRDAQAGTFLRGFEHWFEVDGGLIRYLISGPLYWLSVVDLAYAEDDSQVVTAFKLSKNARDLLEGRPPQALASDGRLHLRSDGRVHIPFNVPRVVRYQVSRFCQWESASEHEYRYRLTPASLDTALDQGLQITHLLSLLKRHTKSIPPNILTALQRWDQQGSEVRLQQAVILRVSSPQILQALRNSRAARFLGDPLGPTTVMIKPGAGEKVLAVLTEMGYFGANELIEP